MASNSNVAWLLATRISLSSNVIFMVYCSSNQPPESNLMVYYRRDKTKGGMYFFTLTLQDRQSKVLTQHVQALRRSFHQAKQNNPFSINAIVVLPDHLHAVWELPPNDNDYSTRWRQIKTYFIRELHQSDYPLIKNKHNEYKLWQRRFWGKRPANYTLNSNFK
jgi:putative transposase